MVDRLRHMNMNKIKRTFSMDKDMTKDWKDALSREETLETRESFETKESIRSEKDRDKEKERVDKDFHFELSIFDASNFVVEDYIQEKLRENTEEGVRSHYQQLKDASSKASIELQKNVHRNYNEFIRTSNLISVMETDMLTVKALLNELRSVGQDLVDKYCQEEKELGTFELKDGDNGSREAQLLKQQRKQEMARILESIDGAGAYLENEDRYLITEGDLVQLDSNYRPVKVVHVNLFNDGILISTVRKATKVTKKKQTIIQPNKLVFEQFIDLQSAVVANVGNTEERNAFQIRHLSTTYAFKATGKEEKERWMSEIKDASKKGYLKVPVQSRKDMKIKEQDIGSSDESPTEEERTKKSQKKKFTSFFGESHEKKRKKEISEEKKSNSLHDKSRGVEVTEQEIESAVLEEKSNEKNEINMEIPLLLNELVEELDVFIAQRQFDESLDHIEEYKLNLSDLPETSNEYYFFKKIMDTQILKLAGSICDDLRNPLQSKYQVKENISRLQKLGFTNQARDVFLESRSTIIKQKIRKLKFEGEIYTYIRKLSQVVFGFLKSTCTWYKMSFDETNLSSGFVRWITQEIEEYCNTFRKHVFQNQNFQTTIDCLRVSAENCNQLRRVGYDCTHFLEQQLQNDVIETIKSYEIRCGSLIAKYVTQDTWDLVSDKDTKISNVTSSGFHFHHTVMSFLEDMESFYSTQLYETIISSLSSLFEKYFRLLLDISSSKSLDDTLQFNLIGNSIYIIDQFLPNVISLVQERFDKVSVELGKLKRRIEAFQELLFEGYCNQKARQYVVNALEFEKMDYNDVENDTDINSLKPSPRFRKNLSSIKTFAETIPKFVKSAILSKLFDQLCVVMLENPFWKKKPFTEEGLYLFLIDFAFFLKVFEPYLTSTGKKKFQEILKKATQSYLEKNQKELPSLELFSKRADFLYQSVEDKFKL